MADPGFVESGAPPDAFKRPPPTIGDVDAHPDSAFIWAVILETRRACAEAREGGVRGRAAKAYPYLG